MEAELECCFVVLVKEKFAKKILQAQLLSLCDSIRTRNMKYPFSTGKSV